MKKSKKNNIHTSGHVSPLKEKVDTDIGVIYGRNLRKRFKFRRREIIDIYGVNKLLDKVNGCLDLVDIYGTIDHYNELD